MFRNAYQSGYLTIFNAVGSKPLQLWETDERDGHVTRVLDDLTRSSALELDGNNAATTSIACPPKRGAELGVSLPHLALLVRAHRGASGFSVEVEVRDDRGVRRRIRASTFQPVSRVAPGIASLPLRLEDEGEDGKRSTLPSRRWHRVPFDLDALVRRAWGTRYRETLRVTVHACCRLRRVYFSEKGYESEAALPPEYRLYVPASVAGKSRAGGNAKASKDTEAIASDSPVAAAAAAAPVAPVEEEEEEEPADADVDVDGSDKGNADDDAEIAEVATAEVVVDGADAEGDEAAAAVEEEGEATAATAVA